MIYTMMQVCKEADLTYQALKFYCNEGLIPNVKRDKNNRRIFDEKDLKWIKDLVCLKKCGMSIQEMKSYLELCLEGPSSIPQRKEMLSRCLLYTSMRKGWKATERWSGCCRERTTSSFPCAGMT